MDLYGVHIRVVILASMDIKYFSGSSLTLTYLGTCILFKQVDPTYKSHSTSKVFSNHNQLYSVCPLILLLYCVEEASELFYICYVCHVLARWVAAGCCGNRSSVCPGTPGSNVMQIFLSARRCHLLLYFHLCETKWTTQCKNNLCSSVIPMVVHSSS